MSARWSPPRGPTGTERYRPRRRSQGCGTSPRWPPWPAPQRRCAPSPLVGRGLDAARGATERLGCARRPRPPPAAGRDVRHAPSFFDHDYSRGTKAHQVVRRGVEQDTYRETGRDPHPIKGAFDMREATKCGADIRRHTPLSTAVNLTDLELDSRLIRISPPRADSNRSPPGRNRFKKTRSKGGRSLRELDLGPVADRVDDSNARGGHNIDGFGRGEYPGADRKSEPSHLAPCGSHPDRPHRGARTASRGATWDRGRALGGGILVAWCAQLADRCDPVLCRLDEHARRFRADAGA